MSRAVFLPNHAVKIAADRAQINPTLVVQRGKGWIKVREEGVCRMCRRSSAVRALTRHHVVPQSYFRNRPKIAPLRHCDANIVPLCGPCHRDIEQQTPHARIELRRLLTTVEIAFVIQVAGQRWLDDRYPSGRAPAAPLGRAGAATRIVYRVASSPGIGATA